MGSKKSLQDGYSLVIVLWTIVILTLIFVNIVDEIHLNSLLTENFLDQKKINLSALAGIKSGIHNLVLDDSENDTINDEWRNPINAKINGFNYNVNITEIGSRLNINYVSYNLLSSLPWWNNDIEIEVKQKGLIAEPLLINHLKKENYNDITIYGHYNINSSRLDAIDELLQSVNTDKRQRELIINSLQKLRSQRKIINLIDEIPARINGLDMLTFDKVKDYLSTTPEININFVSKRLLRLILRYIWNSDDVQQEIAAIITLRREEGITDLDDLRYLLSADKLKKMQLYFTTSSTYFKIESNVNSHGLSTKISVIVERIRETKTRNIIKVLRWNEM